MTSELEDFRKHALAHVKWIVVECSKYFGIAIVILGFSVSV